MAENITPTVKHFAIRRAVIQPHLMTKGLNPGNNIPFDIAPMIVETIMSEGMTQGILMGYIKVVDGTGFLENYPLRGEERLTLELEDAVKNVRVWDLFIYKIDNIEVSHSNKMLIYTLHFMTFQSFMGVNSVLTVPYRGQTIANIANDVFLKHLWREKNDEVFADVDVSKNNTLEIFDETRRQMVSEQTEGFTRLIIPRLNAIKALHFLALRAFSHRSPSTSFRFFETSSCYYFISDEELFRQNLKDEKHIFPMTFADNFVKGGPNFGEEFNNLTTFNNIKRIDTIDDIESGAYKSHVIELDLLGSTVNFRPDLSPKGDFDFYRDMKLYKMADGSDIETGDRHTKEFMELYSRYDNAKQYIVYKDWDEGSDVAAYQLRGEQYFKEIAKRRVPFRRHLESLTVVSQGPGRLDIIPGDIIDVTIKDINADTEKVEDNKQLSGKYLVMHINRRFQLTEATNIYTLVKMNWETTVDTGNVGETIERSIDNAVRGSGILDLALPDFSDLIG